MLRKIQQKQMFEILDTIEKAQSLGLYADCQNGALALCRFINDIEGEGTQTVTLLLEYCELIYQVSINEANKKMLNKQLLKVKNSADHELKPNRIEVAFFPYKASMADSLESIYLAAKEDSNCDAYWVPIPYYNYNPDQTLGQLCYEGNEYPDHIRAQAVNWESYDIEARRPDVIFAHNPYDNNNVVTCVHPNFHFERMQHFTDLLCYVPYFVTADDVPESFCVLPGTIYSDKVFVHSETAKETYTRMFSEWAKVSGITKNHPLWHKVSIPSEKFINLGSPKLDAVINAKTEDFTLPEKWREIIETPYGEKKKIVLYNNRFTDMTAGIENQIAKVKSVLESFKNHDDVVLWWRPHPLNMESLYAMRPQYFIEYKNIVDKYKEEGWGIYDDTPELYRAITWSNAYYGDSSSVTALYNATGKPVFIQNLNISNAGNEYENLRMIFYDFTFIGNKIWFAAWQFNGFFSFNLKSKIVEFYGEMCNQRMFDPYLYISLSVYEDKIIFIPHNGRNMIIYDIVCDKLESVVLKDPTSGMFYNSYCYNDNVYMIPHYNSALVKYNIKSKEISYNYKLCEELNKYKSDVKWYFHKNGIVNGRYLILPSGIANIIVKYDMETDRYTIHHIGSENNKYIDIVYDGVNFWAIPFLGRIVKWNEASETYNEIDGYPQGFTQGDAVNFNCAVLFEEFIFIFPSQSNMVIKLNTKTNEIKQFINLDERKRHPAYIPNSSKYVSVKIIENYIYASSAYENCLQKINPKTGAVENIPVMINSDDFIKIMKKPLFNPLPGVMLEPWLMQENILINLSFFLDRIANEPINRNQISFIDLQAHNKNLDGTCGENIYNYIKEEVL